MTGLSGRVFGDPVRARTEVPSGTPPRASQILLRVSVEHRSRPRLAEGRHLGVIDVLGLPLVNVEEWLLEHVGGVDPSLQAAVEAPTDNSPQTLAVLAEKLRQRVLIARLGLADQRDIAVCFGPPSQIAASINCLVTSVEIIIKDPSADGERCDILDCGSPVRRVVVFCLQATAGRSDVAGVALESEEGRGRSNRLGRYSGVG
jgi:hypothetical protein